MKWTCEAPYTSSEQRLAGLAEIYKCIVLSVNNLMVRFNNTSTGLTAKLVAISTDYTSIRAMLKLEKT